MLISDYKIHHLHAIYSNQPTFSFNVKILARPHSSGAYILRRMIHDEKSLERKTWDSKNKR